MLRHSLIAIALIALSCGAFGFRAHAVATQDTEKVRFGVLDIAVQIPNGGTRRVPDRPHPLPDLPTRVRVVGIEGGEHEAFKTPRSTTRRQSATNASSSRRTRPRRNCRPVARVSPESTTRSPARVTCPRRSN